MNLLCWTVAMMALSWEPQIPPVQGDQQWLVALRDAQRRNLSLFPEGGMRVRVHYQGWDSAAGCRVKARLDWQGNALRITGTKLWNAPRDPRLPRSRPHDFDLLRKEGRFLTYSSHSGVVRIRRAAHLQTALYGLDVPRVHWFGRTPETPWIEFLGPSSHLPQDDVLRYEVHQRSPRLIEVKRVVRDFGATRLVFDLDFSANVVQYETTHEHPRPGELIHDKIRYRWRQNGASEFVLSRMEVETAYLSSRNERRVSHVVFEIDEFSTDAPTPVRLEESDFLHRKGVLVEDGIRNRTYRTSDGPSSSVNSRLDPLAEILREHGFAASERGEQRKGQDPGR